MQTRLGTEPLAFCERRRLAVYGEQDPAAGRLSVAALLDGFDVEDEACPIRGPAHRVFGEPSLQHDGGR